MNTILYMVLAISALVTSSTVNAECDSVKINKWMFDCDSVPKPSQNKCNNRACHNALHYLVEEETVQCYVKLGLGPASDLVKYKDLDNFCHGEGPEPTDPPAPVPTTQSPISSIPSLSPVQVPASSSNIATPTPLQAC
jgi:hypothetical protein